MLGFSGSHLLVNTKRDKHSLVGQDLLFHLINETWMSLSSFFNSQTPIESFIEFLYLSNLRINLLQQKLGVFLFFGVGSNLKMLQKGKTKTLPSPQCFVPSKPRSQ